MLYIVENRFAGVIQPLFSRNLARTSRRYARPGHLRWKRTLLCQLSFNLLRCLLKPSKLGYRGLILLSLLFFVLAGCSHEAARDEAFLGDVQDRLADSTLILVGDTQRTTIWERMILREQNDAPRRELLEKVAQENPAFVVLLGDIVDKGDDDREWQGFDAVAAPLREHHIPIFAALGNHDYWGEQELALRNFFERFPYQKGATWTAVRFHSVGILLLNSNFSSLTPGEIRDQDTWYHDRLASLQQDSSISAIIVGCHHPPYTNSTVVSDNHDVQKHFVRPFLAASKGAIFFTGHCHAYEHFFEHGKNFVVSGGGGGPRQTLESGASCRHHDLFSGGPVRPFHFCEVTVHPDSLSVQVMMLNPADGTWRVGDAWGVGLHQSSFPVIL